MFEGQRRTGKASKFSHASHTERMTVILTGCIARLSCVRMVSPRYLGARGGMLWQLVE